MFCTCINISSKSIIIWCYVAISVNEQYKQYASHLFLETTISHQRAKPLPTMYCQVSVGSVKLNQALSWEQSCHYPSAAHVNSHFSYVFLQHLQHYFICLFHNIIFIKNDLLLSISISWYRLVYVTHNVMTQVSMTTWVAMQNYIIWQLRHYVRSWLQCYLNEGKN